MTDDLFTSKNSIARFFFHVLKGKPSKGRHLHLYFPGRGFSVVIIRSSSPKPTMNDFAKLEKVTLMFSFTFCWKMQQFFSWLFFNKNASSFGHQWGDPPRGEGCRGRPFDGFPNGSKQKNVMRFWISNEAYKWRLNDCSQGIYNKLDFNNPLLVSL